MPAIRRTLVFSAALTALLGYAAPVLAQSPALDAPMILSDSGPTDPHGDPLNATSANWAGYAATGHRFTSVHADWVQPAANCDTTDTWSSFWAGLDGDGSSTVEQTGTMADCSGGSPRYAAWYEMYPAYPVDFSDPVAPGDHLSASVTAGAGGQFTLVLSDQTRNWSHTVRKTLRGARLASAEVIAEAPSSGTGVLPLTDFGTVQFGSATANGQAIGTFSPAQIAMAAQGGATKAATSPLSSGSDFSVAWQHH
ncbi:G1 family glutamic endopeptidase [Kitasatospora acidiphila]|uniref:G1 family glutamic endopeptidase n=1 Tax=Kitasatospora acidiphila TaxID=2567942 RepID=UPI003C75216B